MILRTDIYYNFVVSTLTFNENYHANLDCGNGYNSMYEDYMYMYIV